MNRDEIMAELSKKAALGDKAKTLDQFRADFKFVLKRMHDLGQMSQAELEEEYRIESDAIRRHSHDEAWMRAAGAHFREMAERFERDIARSERIRAEEEAKRLAAWAMRRDRSRSERIAAEVRADREKAT